MSELARAYYQERAARLGIDNVPPILSGTPWQMGPDPAYTLLTYSHSRAEIEASLLQRYDEVLRSVGDFVTRCAGKVSPLPEEYHQEAMRQQEQHARSITQHLIHVPPDIPAQLHDIQIEAITSDEISMDDAKIALRLFPWKLEEQYEDQMVYLATKATINVPPAQRVNRALTFVHMHHIHEPPAVIYGAVAYPPQQVK